MQIHDEHDKVRQLINTKQKQQGVITHSILLKELIFSDTRLDSDSKKFYTELYSCLKNYYIAYESYDEKYLSINYDIYEKNWGMVSRIGIMDNQFKQMPFLKSLQQDKIIKLDSLHSFAKDNGKYFIKDLIKLSDRLDYPIFLYDENSKDENYFINLGFDKIDLGIGINIRLMIKKPNQ